MEEGDFVITPPWTWHDHGNDSDAPMIWLDGLDIPLVRFFDTSFAEGYPEDEQPITVPDVDSNARFDASLLPVDYQSASPISPLFAYPYARTREALEVMRQREEWDPSASRCATPTRTMAATRCRPSAPSSSCCQRGSRPDATAQRTPRSLSAWKGRALPELAAGHSKGGPRDIFVAPSWQPVIHQATADSVLFSFSDRPVQEKLALWREKRG